MWWYSSGISLRVEPNEDPGSEGVFKTSHMGVHAIHPWYALHSSKIGLLNVVSKIHDLCVSATLIPSWSFQPWSATHIILSSSSVWHHFFCLPFTIYSHSSTSDIFVIIHVGCWNYHPFKMFSYPSISCPFFIVQLWCFQTHPFMISVMSMIIHFSSFHNPFLIL